MLRWCFFPRPVTSIDHDRRDEAAGFPVLLNIRDHRGFTAKTTVRTRYHYTYLVTGKSEWAHTQDALTGLYCTAAAPSFLCLDFAWSGTLPGLFSLEVPSVNTGPDILNPMRQSTAHDTVFYFSFWAHRNCCTAPAPPVKTKPRHVPHPYFPWRSSGLHVSRDPSIPKKINRYQFHVACPPTCGCSSQGVNSNF